MRCKKCHKEIDTYSDICCYCGAISSTPEVPCSHDKIHSLSLKKTLLIFFAVFALINPIVINSIFDFVAGAYNKIESSLDFSTKTQNTVSTNKKSLTVESSNNEKIDQNLVQDSKNVDKDYLDNLYKQANNARNNEKNIKKAIQYYEEGCSKNHGASCETIADMLLNETSSVNNIIAYYTKACSLDIGSACSKASAIMAGAEEVPDEKIVSLNERGCHLKDANSCYNMAIYYENGIVKKKDLSVAFSLYSYACQQNNGDACYRYGQFLDEGILDNKNPKLALKAFEKACKLDVGDACGDAGVMYEDGEGTEINYKLAAEYYSKGCRVFVSTPSCQLLGYLYEEGKGVEKSKKSALDLFQIGCQHDDEVGCYTLGKRYETSDGSDYNRDYNKAEFYFIKSCKLGFGEACFELATMYATDEYGKKSVTNHIKQLQRSCELEYAKGCTELGTMYVISYVNKTLPNNITDPLEPLKLACKYGDPEGCNRLGESYKEGFVNTTNLEKAKEYFDLACKLDSNYCE